MKKQIFCLMAFAAVCGMMFTGCKKDSMGREGGITLGATIEQVGGPDSKIYLGTNDIPHFFASGENVNINGENYEIVGSETKYSITDVTEQTDGKYYAFYPASMLVLGGNPTRENTYTVGTDGSVNCNVFFPHVQHYVEQDGHQKLDLPVGAVINGSGNVLRFYNLCSLVEVTYSPNGSVKLTSIEVTAEKKGLWGEGTATINGANSELNIPYNDKNSRVILEIPDETFSTDKTFYVMVPPFDGNTDEFTVKLRFDDGHSSVTKARPNVNLSRNTIVSIATSTVPEEDTEISGYFSISDNCKVVFSRGNLQHRGNPWNTGTGTWFFADNQYDFYGVNNLASGSSYYEDVVLSNTIDLFCYSIDNEDRPYTHVHEMTTPSYGVRAPEETIEGFYSYVASYNQHFKDWGELSISGDAPKTWFTLTNVEWDYLLNSRVDGNGRRLRANVQITGVSNHPAGSVTTINGFMLFPDDWTDDCIPSGITDFSYTSVNTISEANWRRFEAAGAVFLPAAGWRNPEVNNAGNVWIAIEHTYQDGYYWTSTIQASGESKYMYYQFNANNYLFETETEESWWHYGQSVRLVKPAPGYTYEDAERDDWGPATSSK